MLLQMGSRFERDWKLKGGLLKWKQNQQIRKIAESQFRESGEDPESGRYSDLMDSYSDFWSLR